MLKNILHLTLLGVLWKRYKSIIISTMLLFVYFWLVSKLHQDYVSYSELNKDHEFLALSFFIKWCAFFIGVVIYLFFNSFYPRAAKPDRSKVDQVKKEAAEKPTTPDPFNEIRQKPRLRSRADFVIEKNKK
jgi:hypothetical protein